MDLHIVTLVRVSLFPIAAATFILLLSLWDHNATSGSYVIFAAFAFILSALVFGEASFYRALGAFPVRIAFSNIVARWLIVSATVGFLAHGAGFHVYFSQPVAVAWFILTPFVLLGAHILARVTLRHLILSTQSPRTAVIVGTTPPSATLRAKIKEDPLLNIHVAGFFDDPEIQRSIAYTTGRRFKGLVR